MLVKLLFVVVSETSTYHLIFSGKGRFKSVMDLFKLKTAQWKLLAQVEPKDSVSNFYGPKFDESDYRFIFAILKENWPNKEVVEKIIEK